MEYKITCKKQDFELTGHIDTSKPYAPLEQRFTLSRRLCAFESRVDHSNWNEDGTQ